MSESGPEQEEKRVTHVVGPFSRLGERLRSERVSVLWVHGYARPQDSLDEKPGADQLA